ncbi:DUF1801 domain-containing protein [Sphingobium yanoikuyae]|uniref:DUF1801 domain-containing protein n=1 Tax=Sphingobium yanoikuyae TaxID=13690 RepID=A0AA43BD17_SPHYA|nr:DUF1801 domain-containing protein [Sphingobium yanoikuyae]MDH2133875.1 DUF1801 domain-containing protein [Sphingobium yanoikuyae]MDH2152650.1 DUF1801 domain-containing protein [Sphingobium yanoikuyae]MDH2169189.1 DUF1801 domain-containing protein [Sphingobium yanoikuyae]
MATGENKTMETMADVAAYLDTVEPAERQADGRIVAALMARLSGEPPRLWGPSIIGFGRYHYRYDSGREGDMCRIGFAPRKAELVFYLAGLDDADFMALGKHRRGKGCLYVKRLADIDMGALEALIAQSLAHMDGLYPR